MEKYFLGCDWGTSSFRLRLIEVFNQKVIAEVVSSQGIATMHKKWIEVQDDRQHKTKGDLYREYLQDQINSLSGKCTVNLNELAIVISGMASSSIGLEELPYAKVPFALNGASATAKRLEAEKNFSHEIILVSGVCSEADVMRGEETQMIGLMSLLPGERNNRLSKGIFILPGTHSKHIYVNEVYLVDFQTFMTGELFNVIAEHTILKNSVQRHLVDDAEIDVDAFKAGVTRATTNSILNGLFTVRTNQLFSRFNMQENASYLSGLLIGEELKLLLGKSELPLYLCSGQNLSNFYKLALDSLNLLSRTSIVPSGLMDQAAVFGQNIIFKRQILNVDQ